MILDSDCVWVDSADRVSADLDSYGLLAYDLGQRTTDSLSGADLEDIYTELDQRPQVKIPNYYGGELFAARGDVIQRVVAEIGSVWENSLQRFKEHKPKLYEEAFVLSYIYHRLGYAEPTANAYIKRLWTGSKFNNVELADMTLAIWHLPAEKKRGIKRLFHQACLSRSRFWRTPLGESFARYVGQYVGIPTCGRKKYFLDMFDSQFSKLWDKVLSVRTA
ncbi:MAG: hypothetical protein F6K19_24215 [Cyanothece sp. SIO1E1]|nr:hypothetical protein [Cyanothece sp. SIO1E1]